MTAVLDPTITGEVNANELATALATIAHFADPDKSIPMLNSILLEARAGRLTAVATDRYVLGTYEIPFEGHDFSALVPLVDAKALTAVLKRQYKAARVSLGCRDDRLTVVHYEGEVRIRLNDHDYPKWRALIPDAKDAQECTGISLSPTNIARFAKVPHAKTEPMHLFFKGRLKPVRVQIGESFVGLIMPMRSA